MAQRQWILSLLVGAVLPLTQAAQAAVANPVNGQEDLLRAAESGQFSAQQCTELAESFGELVARQREIETRRDPLLGSRQLGEKIHNGCREGIRKLELSTNEDEGALETLYRSQIWYEVNRALAALRYWQAWLDLSLAQHAQDQAARVTGLSRAERGFQAASLRILYPGLVYGSWLGLAYVAQLQEDEATMKQRLSLLKQALELDPDNPLHEIIDTELSLIALRANGGGTITIVQGEPLTATTARLVKEQAMALLAGHREHGSGANEAAKYLRQLIAQGFLDDRLFARILQYRDEVVGHDIGPLGLLVDAEFAYMYQQYESNVLKFRQFLLTDAVTLPLNLTLFRYHYAVSLYQIELTRDSMEIIEGLRKIDSLAPELQASVVKLQFIVAEAMYQSQPSTARASRLESAAREFIGAAATDPDIASAHLALARVVDDADVRALHLKQAGADARLEDSVRAVELEVALGRFQGALTDGEPEVAFDVARSALALLEDLPRRQRDTLEMQVLAVQLRSVITEDVMEVLQSLDILYTNPALNLSQKRVLAWARLRLIDRGQGPQGLREFFAGLPAVGMDSAIDHELYVLLREFESGGRNADLAQLCELWLPRLPPQPQLQRQVWLLQIRALRAIGQDTEALQAIRAMLASFPNSGDAWEQLAQQSEAMGDSFAAERALAHIAAAEPEGSSRWLDVSLHRLQLLVASEAGASRSCSLQQRIEVYNHRLEQSQQQILAGFTGNKDCPGQQEY